MIVHRVLNEIDFKSVSAINEPFNVLFIVTIAY